MYFRTIVDVLPLIYCQDCRFTLLKFILFYILTDAPIVTAGGIHKNDTHMNNTFSLTQGCNTLILSYSIHSNPQSSIALRRQHRHTSTIYEYISFETISNTTEYGTWTEVFVNMSCTMYSYNIAGRYSLDAINSAGNTSTEITILFKCKFSTLLY